MTDARLLLCWSGGKDSALSLWTMREREKRLPRALLSTVSEPDGRISMHGVRGELLRLQAQRIGLPLVEVAIPNPCPNDVYEARMAAALAGEALAGVDEVAFGDLFLEEIRAYREARLSSAGKRACFPVWGLDTAELARGFIALGFRAVLVCVDPRPFGGAAAAAALAGREFDEELLAELPEGVDPCGENGEFHTFVYDGPLFSAPVPHSPGEVAERGGFIYCDLRAGTPA